MSPEYASEGIFSIKSDVYSFGVLLLEIVSGKRNSGHHRQYGDFINLLGYVSVSCTQLLTKWSHACSLNALSSNVPFILLMNGDRSLQAWQLWREGRAFELIDPTLGECGEVASIMRCVKVALLCVQDSADDRPNMSEVVAMLGSEGITMPEPRQPAYYNVRISSLAVSSDSFGESSCRISNITLTDHEEGR